MFAILKVEALDSDGAAGADREQQDRVPSLRGGEADRRGERESQLPGERRKSPGAPCFNGLAQVILQSTKRPGEIHVEAGERRMGWSGTDTGEAVDQTRQTEARPSVPVAGSERAEGEVGEFIQEQDGAGRQM